MRPIRRIALTVFALALGTALVFGLAYIGKNTQGPIQDMFTNAGDAIRGLEEKAILKQRSEARIEQLRWLERSPEALRNPPRILLGAYDEHARESLKTLFDLEAALQTTFPLVQIYTAWGSKADQAFPKIQVQSILKSGSIPVITWEPWLTDFDASAFPDGLRPVETRDKNGLQDVAKGVYDTYLRTWARAAAKVGQPIFLRVGHEMNDPYRYPWGPQNNQVEDFLAAWRHIHGIFKAENAENVLWVWSPHPAYGLFEAYYPGDAFVDWVGVGVLNYGTVAHWSRWWLFDDIFGKYYSELAVFDKPIMISEFGSLAVGGDRTEWYTDALSDLPERYPLVRGLLFFHFSNDKTTTQQPLDWTIKNDPEILSEVTKIIRSW